MLLAMLDACVSTRKSISQRGCLRVTQVLDVRMHVRLMRRTTHACLQATEVTSTLVHITLVPSTLRLFQESIQTRVWQAMDSTLQRCLQTHVWQATDSILLLAAWVQAAWLTAAWLTAACLTAAWLTAVVRRTIHVCNAQGRFSSRNTETCRMEVRLSIRGWAEVG